MAEQFFDCHYIHAAIHKTRSKRVPQRMPRHASNPRLLTCPSETRFEINKRLPGLEIVENEFILSAQRPSRQHFSSSRIDRDASSLLRLWCEDIQNVFFEVHVRPVQAENFGTNLEYRNVVGILVGPQQMPPLRVNCKTSRSVPRSFTESCLRRSPLIRIPSIRQD